MKLTATTKTGAKSRPGLIQFDLDGTVLDTHQIILRSMQYTVNEVFHNSYSDEELMAFVGTPLIDQMHHFCPEDPNRAFTTYITYQKTLPSELISVFEGMEHVLDKLRSFGFDLAVVTAKRHETAHANLQDKELLGHFKMLVACDDVVRSKPNPYPVTYTAHKLSYPLQQCVYVGDSPFDIQAANSAGAFSVAVTWGIFTQEELSKHNPIKFAYHPNDLLTIIPDLLGTQEMS